MPMSSRERGLYGVGRGDAALENCFALQAHALQIFGTYKRVAT